MTKVTQQTFDVVKIMLNGGASPKEIAEFLKLAPGTISKIKQAETLGEYRNICAAYHIAQKKNKENAATEQKAAKEEPKPQPEPKDQVQTNPVQSSYQSNRMIELLKEQNELLKLISAKLVFVVEQLS